MYKYYFYTDAEGRRCIKCVSHYAGKPVSGIAKCSVDDPYNEEMGKALAKARCDVKVADRRHIRACTKLSQATVDHLAAQSFMDSMKDYYASASEELAKATESLMDLERQFYEDAE